MPLLSQTKKSPRQYRGIFHALSTVLREEGARALYKGWLPSVIGVVSKFFLVVSPFGELVTSSIANSGNSSEYPHPCMWSLET